MRNIKHENERMEEISGRSHSEVQRKADLIAVTQKNKS